MPTGITPNCEAISWAYRQKYGKSLIGWVRGDTVQIFNVHHELRERLQTLSPPMPLQICNAMVYKEMLYDSCMCCLQIAVSAMKLVERLWYPSMCLPYLLSMLGFGLRVAMCSRLCQAFGQEIYNGTIYNIYPICLQQATITPLRPNGQYSVPHQENLNMLKPA